jgi:hypothetical protein
MLHEGFDFQGLSGKADWAIVQKTIAVAMV